MRLLLLAVPLLLVALAAPHARPAPAQAQDDEVAIEIVDFAFEPATIEVTVGTTVTWTNQDGAPHTATADDFTFDSGRLDQGQSFSFTFDEPGTYPYHCEIHPNMTAEIVVVEAQEDDEATPTEEATEAPTPTEAAEATEAPTRGATEVPTRAPAAVPTLEPTEAATPEPAGDGVTVLGAPTDGGPALEFVGKVDQRGTDFTFYGYVARLAGVEPATLFADPDPANWNEATAHITYFGTASQTTRSVVDQQLFVLTIEGTATFYANARAGASFERPESFFGGTAIAEAETTQRNVLAVVAPATGVASGSGELTIATATDFDLDGERYRFGEVGARLLVDYSGVGTLLEPTEPRAVLAVAGAMTAVAAADTATGEPGEEPAATPEGAADALTISLDELNESGISGSATLEATDGDTVVTLALDGATGGHPAHIHRGTCDDLDPSPEHPLSDVDEEGESETTVEGVTLEELTAEPFAINVHLSNEEVGVYVACGNIAP